VVSDVVGPFSPTSLNFVLYSDGDHFLDLYLEVCQFFSHGDVISLVDINIHTRAL
jgi:hypothetical protein